MYEDLRYGSPETSAFGNGPASISAGLSYKRVEVAGPPMGNVTATQSARADAERLPDPSLVTYTHAVYALHTLSVLIGITSPATIVGSFLFSLPSILAVIMNYARRSEASGTYLESHFRWQIRTFWYALLWMCAAALVSTPLVLALGLGILTFFVAAVAVGAWVIYRVGRGWFALRKERPLVF